MLQGEPCTKVGVVRHVACDDLDEGSFAITPYDEEGATAVAVAPMVLTEGGKRRRVSVPLLIKKRNPRLDRSEAILKPLPVWGEFDWE